jgi:hypothetical protein
MRHAPLRTLVLFLSYALAVWVTAFQGLHGDDTAGLVCALLLLGGAGFLVYLAFFRRRSQPAAASAVVVGALALLGVAIGTASAGESEVGLIGGAIIGVVAAILFAVSRRRRRRVKTIFISYRRSDSGDVVARIRERLGERFGAENIFRDLDSMELGARFRDVIADAIHHSDAVLVVIGSNWLSATNAAGRRLDDPDDLVRVEIETALRHPRLLVVPLAVNGASLPRPDDLPGSLRELTRRSGGVVRNPPDFEADAARLIRGLEQGAVTPWSLAAPAPVPWRRVAAMSAIVLLPPATMLLELPAADYRYIRDAALRPTSPMIATAHAGGLRIWSTRDGGELVTMGDRLAASLAWSPDGSRLAYVDRDGVVVVLESDSWRELGRFDATDWSLQLAWHPRGDAIVTGDRRGTLRCWSLRDGGLRFTVHAHQDRIAAVRWSPDGSRIASAGWDRAVAITDATSGAMLRRLEGHRSFVKAVDWSTRNQTVASGSLEAPSVVVWQPQAGWRAIAAAGASGSVEALAWSPDGSRLAAAANDETVRVWDATGTLVHVFGADLIGAPGFAWSPDSARLAVVDRRVSIYDVNSGSRIRQWPAHDDGYSVRVIGWAADPPRLATSGLAEDAVKVWNADSGELVTTVKVGLLRALADRFF